MGWNQADPTWIGTLVWVLSCHAIRVGQSLNLLEPWFPHLSTGQMPASHRQLYGSAAVYTHCLAQALPGKCSEYGSGLLSSPLCSLGLPLCVLGGARWGSSVVDVGNHSGGYSFLPPEIPLISFLLSG